jgi:hypothetical protein
MSRQYNKIEKARRRERRHKRQKDALNATLGKKKTAAKA